MIILLVAIIVIHTISTYISGSQSGRKKDKGGSEFHFVSSTIFDYKLVIPNIMKTALLFFRDLHSLNDILVSQSRLLGFAECQATT